MSKAKPKIIINSNPNHYDLNFDQINDDLPLAQAFFELLTNAFDSVKGDLNLVSIEVVHSNEIIIHDQGPGIMRQHLRFSRTNHQSNETGRFGIGLKDALAIIVNNGGNIKIESKHLLVNKLVRRAKEGYQEETYHASIVKHDPEMIGTRITVTAIGSEVALEEAKDRLIYYYPEEHLFTCPKGEIYVNNGESYQFYRGVLTCEGAKSLYTYNVYQNLSTEKIVTRDRTKLSKDALNQQISTILLKVPDDSELLVPLLEAYKAKTKYIEFKYKPVRDKLDNIIKNQQADNIERLPNGLQAVIIEPTPNEQKRIDQLFASTGFNYVVVSKFISRYNTQIESVIVELDIYLLRDILNLKRGQLAKHLGSLFIKETITFENDYPIRDVMVDIVEALT